MAFRFAARTLLELGRELISSDEIAIYELIKNAVDAGSPRVEIVAEIVLPHSSYLAAIEALDEGAQPHAVFDRLRGQIIPGISPDRAATFLGLLEKCVWRPNRFKSALKSSYRRLNWIEVRDTGHGMSLQELDDIFLTVGTRSRRSANVAGAKFLGDKGVGRLSTMRLGDQLTVITSRTGESHWSLLRVNWGIFTHELEADISEIPVKPRRGRVKQDPSEQGTRIRVTCLNADWNMNRFADVLQGKIARMVDPFEPGGGSRLLVARYNGGRILIPSIPRKLLTAAHAYCHAALRFEENGEPVLEGKISYRTLHKERPLGQRGVEVYSIAQNVWGRRGKQGHAATVAAPIRTKALQELGPFEVDVYWFNRRVVHAVEGLTNNMLETKAEIARWSGGPMLYRLGFRILPYGNPDDDWLELDRNAFGQAGFKLNRQQVIGRIRVSSPHTVLSEQTNREGLVQSGAADALRNIMMWLLHSEMRGLINEADKAEKLRRRDAERLTFEFRDTQKIVNQYLDELRRRIGPEQKAYVDQLRTAVATLTDQCQALVAKTNQLVDEAVEEREKFVYLAGIGLMTDFIFHELDRAVAHSLKALADARGSKESVLRSLEEQLITLQKRISTFDELAGERRQTKALFNMAEVVQLVLDNHVNQFRRHSIKVIFHPPKSPLMVKAVRGMVIQILENLVANSVYWLKLQGRYEEAFQPQIWININPELHVLTLEDNGPGIDPERNEVIFQPFVTSKPLGQGRGLGLYISRELAHYHGWQLLLDPEIGRRRPGRSSLFILDMSQKP